GRRPAAGGGGADVGRRLTGAGRGAAGRPRRDLPGGDRLPALAGPDGGVDGPGAPDGLFRRGLRRESAVARRLGAPRRRRPPRPRPGDHPSPGPIETDRGPTMSRAYRIKVRESLKRVI